MKLYDVSRVISPSTAGYPGDDPLAFSEVCCIGPEAPVNITGLEGWTTHFLTHVDPPRHFIEGGKTLDEIPLDRFLMEAIVVEVDGEAVEATDVPTNVAGKGVLFKTRNSKADPATFDENHVYISRSAAEAIVEQGANLAGIDYLSVDRFGDEDYPAHRTLLGAEVLVLEGLDLSDVAPGSYHLSALPLRIEAGDGSPVRAVLQELGR